MLEGGNGKIKAQVAGLNGNYRCFSSIYLFQMGYQDGGIATNPTFQPVFLARLEWCGELSMDILMEICFLSQVLSRQVGNNTQALRSAVNLKQPITVFGGAEQVRGAITEATPGSRTAWKIIRVLCEFAGYYYGTGLDLLKGWVHDQILSGQGEGDAE